MKKNYDIVLNMINNIRNEEKYLNKLEEIIDKYGVKQAINILKATGISINTHETINKKINKLYEKSSDIIEKRISDKSEEMFFIKFKKESEILNGLYKDFYSKESHQEIKNIPDEYKLCSYLISIENSLRIIRSKCEKNTIKNYLLDIKFRKQEGDRVKSIDRLSVDKIVSIHDKYIEDASIALHAMLFYGYTYNNKKFNNCLIDEDIDTAYMYTSCKHNDLVDIMGIINDLYNKWRFNYIDLQINNNIVENIIRDRDSIILNDIMDFRFESERISTQLNSIENYGRRVTNSKDLLPSGILDEIEELDRKYCERYLYIKDFNAKINQVKINEWMRAFAILRVLSTEYLRNNKHKMSQKLEDWVLVMSQEELEKEFEDKGIDKSITKNIIMNLTFNRKSKSILNSPILNIEDKLLIIPSICRSITGTTSLIELASSQEWDMSFKGSNFEKYMKEKFDESNNKTYMIKKYDSLGNEYECDAVLKLDKDLYFIEYKNHLQPFGDYSKMRFQKYQEECVEQINRISKFYLENLNYIRDKFKLDLSWKPRTVYKIVVFSCKLGKSYINGTNIVTDSNILESIILKKHPAIMLNGNPMALIQHNKYKNIYQGKLTSTKIINGIKNPYQIEVHKETLKEEIIDVRVNNLKIKYRDNRKQLPDFIVNS